MPWAVAAAAVAAGGAIYSSKKTSDATKKAARGATGAADQAQEFLEQGVQSARGRLQPYADQEAMGRNQMMRQLGLIPAATSYAPPGAVMGAGPSAPASAPPSGAGIVPIGAPAGAGGADDLGIGRDNNFNRFLEDLIGDQIAISSRAGYSDRNNKAATEGARRAEGFLRTMKRQGKLPESYEVPRLDELTEFAVNMKSSGIDFGNYGLSDETGRKGRRRGQNATGPESYEYALRRLESHGGSEQLFPEPEAQAPAAPPAAPAATTQAPAASPQPAVMGEVTAAVQPERQFLGDDQRPAPPTTPGAYMGSGSSGVPVEGGVQTEFLEKPDTPGAAEGGVETIQHIQHRAGVTAPDEDFQKRYYQDIESPTPQFGMGYQDNPAYRAMMDETARNVNQYAANAGSLYSGRRGEALREASAQTQMGFYQDLADREQRNYEGGLNRRGAAIGGIQGREDQYYNNYMNLLQNLASPTTATNLANIEVGQAGTIGQNAIAAQSDASKYNLMGQQAQNAAVADVATGIGGLLNRKVK